MVYTDWFRHSGRGLCTVYVFLGEYDAMIDMIFNLDERGLLATGDYAIIYCDFYNDENRRSADNLLYYRRQ